MNKSDIILKRLFDVLFSILGLLVFGVVIIIMFIISIIDTQNNGIFRQKRVGQYGKLFNIYKIRTLKKNPSGALIPTTFGNFLRKTKLDELPQLYNVLKGDMSFVGPRPDIEGFADKLQGDDKIILSIRPGITGLASLNFKNEETLLSCQKNPTKYNREVIWPIKIELNKIYIKEYSFFKDLKIIFKTIFRT